MKENITLVIFDADGTLCSTKSGKEFRHGADDWQVLPGRAEKLAELHAAYVKTGIASNQGGVAFGFLKADEIHYALLSLARELGIPGKNVLLCTKHPNAKLDHERLDSFSRKPRPGMLLEIMNLTGTPPGKTLMVGDREEDRGAAQQAGCAFVWAKDFFWTPESE